MPVRPPLSRRRAVSVTSLIDVIFLLLLFFMLTSTFTKYSELRLDSATSGVALATTDAPPLFLHLGPGELSLNARPVALAALPGALAERAGDGALLIVSPRDGVTAQRLVDVLAVLRGVAGLSVQVLD